MRYPSRNQGGFARILEFEARNEPLNRSIIAVFYVVMALAVYQLRENVLAFLW